MKIKFWVPGVPKPAGSKSGFVNPKTGKVIIVDASGKGGKSWRSDVKSFALDVMRGRDLFSGPLILMVDFVMPRPKTHYRANGELKSNAPQWCVTKPDSTKLLRALEDALTGIVWRDDAQVALQIIRKLYGTTPGASVCVFTSDNGKEEGE